MRPIFLVNFNGRLGRFLRRLAVFVALVLLVVYAMWGVSALVGASLIVLWIAYGVLRMLGGASDEAR